ncbi:MerR family transcriptional regulator [Streptomyces olivaceiscleroticus]|uniref:MerR family transcriptional regulator n=1 Tax=Streptomyces olivaceiscleroticus TaxID=68245 RepID=A0ABP3K7V0_9ACTN
MRIGELSRRTGVAVPTIKYYVREGLLPAGRLTSPNQADYDETHERRLRLVRGLIEVGGLSVSAVREVLAAVEDTDRPVHKVLGSAHESLTPPHAVGGAELAGAREAVAALVARRGWQAAPDSAAGEALAGALATLRGLGHGGFEEVLDAYADACERIAAADLTYVGRAPDVERLVEGVVVGTVIGDAVLSAMRRLAHADASARRYGAADD